MYRDSLLDGFGLLVVAAVTVGGGVGAAGAMHAQEIARMSMADDASPGADDLEVQRAAAEALRRRAASLLGQPGRWTDAAILYRESVRLGPADDPRAVGSLRLAGRIFQHVHLRDRSIECFEEAADLAAASGEPLTAAMAHMEAGFVAAATGDERQAGRLAARAVVIAAAADLPQEHRAAITRRILLYSPPVTGGLPVLERSGAASRQSPRPLGLPPSAGRPRMAPMAGPPLRPRSR